MRSKYVALNANLGIINQLVNGIANLIIRRVILITVGIEYLGINGLFANIFQLLGLAESGFGVAIVYMLYKPISENDEERIAQFLNYYKKIYQVVAIIILLVGILIIPFLQLIIKDDTFSIKDIAIYYFLYLLNIVSSYFLAYKTSFLTACQRQYFVSLISICMCIMFTILKCLLLVTVRNYFVYLILIILNTCLVNIFVSIAVDKKYPYIKKNKDKKLEEEKRKKITNNVKALFLHKIGSYVLNGTDNLVITYFIGLSMVGIYSNYILVISMINIFVSQIFSAILPAFGNIIAEESSNGTNKIYKIYKSTYFFSFIIYGGSSVLLCVLFQPFILLWTGESQYMLDYNIVLLLILNFYLGGMRSAPNAVKSAAGIYQQDRFSPICEALFNLVLSILLAYKMGIAGVILGTIISGLLMPFWTAPFFVYRDLFKIPFRKYLIDSIKYFLLTVMGFGIVYTVCGKVQSDKIFVPFVVLFLITGALTAVYYMIIFFLMSEHKDLMPYINMVKNKFLKRWSK